MQASEWIMSEGGPLMIVNIQAIADWGGVLARKTAEPRYANDYEKACETKGYLRQISLKGGSALLLGDAPLDTCFGETNKIRLILSECGTARPISTSMRR